MVANREAIVAEGVVTVVAVVPVRVIGMGTTRSAASTVGHPIIFHLHAHTGMVVAGTVMVGRVVAMVVMVVVMVVVEMMVVIVTACVI